MAEPEQQYPPQPAFAIPRLELPRFQFAPSSPAPAAPRPQLFVHPRPVLATTPAPTMALPVREPAPAPTPVDVATPPPAPAAIAWSAPVVEPARRSLLQQISPVHIGVLVILAVIAMVMTSGPSSMRSTPTKLDAVAGGGVTDSPAPVRMIKIGTVSVPANIHAGGIPSPAAAAQLAVTGGGSFTLPKQDGVMQMDGIPSPAAAAALAPQQLPYRPDDGVTLPSSITERDSYAVDAHYGANELPMEEPAAPVVTPGDAVVHAEHQAAISDLTGDAPQQQSTSDNPAAGYL